MTGVFLSSALKSAKPPVAAKRVILQAIKGGRGPDPLLPGLVLHAADGSFTAAAEAVLRHAEALPPG